MKTKSAMIASAADLLQPAIHSRTRATPGTRRSAVGAEQSEDSTTRETEGGFDELRESCGHTCSADVVVAPYEKTNRLGFHLRCLGICIPTRSKHTTSGG